jgi:hypothetical protein
MFGRDDKWVGQTAAAILLYGKLIDSEVIQQDFDPDYAAKIALSWQWLKEHTTPDAYPPGGYLRVNGTTTTKPPENLLWMTSWTIEALLAGERLFQPA